MEKEGKEFIEMDFEGEGLAPVSLEAIEGRAIIIVVPSEDKEDGNENTGG